MRISKFPITEIHLKPNTEECALGCRLATHGIYHPDIAGGAQVCYLCAECAHTVMGYLRTMYPGSRAICAPIARGHA